MIEVSQHLIDKCVEALKEASANYGGTNTQFARKYGMSPSVWSEIKNGKTDNKLSPQKWLNIASILGVRDSDRVWKMARTEVFDAISDGVNACKEFSWGMIFVDKCAIGKTYSAKYLAKTLKNCFYVDGSQCKTRMLFTRALAQTIGVELGGRYVYNTGIPDFEIDSLARALLPAIQKLFETEEGKREFEEWKAERQRLQLNKKQNKESR